MIKRKTLLHVLLVTSITILTGCSLPFFSYGENGLSKDAFADYVESVFRLQNSLTSEVMLLDSSDDSARQKALSSTEQAMRTDCAALNEYAERDSDGLSVGLSLSHRVEQSAVQCEKAAQRLKALLDD